MTQYNCLNVKLSNSQLNKLKNGTHVTLNLSSNKSLKVFFFIQMYFLLKNMKRMLKQY